MQTVQFKMEDITFFKKNAAGQLWCLPKSFKDAPDNIILSADSATPGQSETGGKAYACTKD
jgi:hypothetical protein